MGTLISDVEIFKQQGFQLDLFLLKILSFDMNKIIMNKWYQIYECYPNTRQINVSAICRRIVSDLKTFFNLQVTLA